MNVKLEELKSKPLALLTVEEFMQLQAKKNENVISTEYVSEIIGIEEAIKLTGYKKSTLYRKTSTNTIPFHKRGNKVLFKRSELEAWLLEYRNETIEERLNALDKKLSSSNKKA